MKGEMKRATRNMFLLCFVLLFAVVFSGTRKKECYG